MLSYVWDCPTHDEAVTRRLADSVGVDPLIGRLLWQRGLTDADAAYRFLHPALDHLHDPMRLADMGRAVDRLLEAVAKRERIVVHGDYDVDGITATVIVRRMLEMLGGRVSHFVPERIRDGYGLNVPTIDRLHAEGARVIVSVDCGIRGGDAARRARELGIDLIITDHHEPEAVLPDAYAVINPKRLDCSYPDKQLAGVGVALKLIQALCGRAGRDRWLPGFIKLAALGTLADVVPLLGENRVIASLGLDALSQGPHKAGLRALIEVSGLAGRRIDSYHVAFMLAPRLNAAGRMSTPDLALRLLLASEDHMLEEARGLAEQLNRENERRQQEELVVVAEARRVVEHDPDVGSRSVLVVAGDGWHRGVIGIVASKLVDIYHRPAIVIAVEGDTAYGSCRSIPEFDMLHALESCGRHLARFGGHQMAAGLTLTTSEITPFRDAMATVGDDRLGPDDLRPRLRLDAPLGFRCIRPEFYEALNGLAPFGLGNPRPVFFTRGAQVSQGPRRMKERHLSMGLRHDGVVLRGVFWRGADHEALIAGAREGLDVAFSVEQNTFNGMTSLQLTLADVKASDPAAS
jgi:single-stranded-DNA-specific exonuclease